MEFDYETAKAQQVFAVVVTVVLFHSGFFFLMLNLDNFQNVFQDNFLILDEKMMNLASLQFYLADSKVN